MLKETEWLLQEKYNGQKSESFLDDCARLEAGEPLAYVIGHIPFLDCTIWLDSKPLIPRPETEFWVEKAIAHIAKSFPRVNLGKKLDVLDLCAGSGCIGVAIAKAFPEVQVDFVEIDASHHPTIKKNLRENCTPITRDRCAVFGGDLFCEIPTGTKYDFILSNPPYIDPALDRTEPSVKNYEPHQALYGGDQGLALIAQIIATAPTYLGSGGELWLEHEPEQSETIASLATDAGFSCHTHQDQYEVERFSRLVVQ
jgi:release factor glutamine methyltransferase